MKQFPQIVVFQKLYMFTTKICWSDFFFETNSKTAQYNLAVKLVKFYITTVRTSGFGKLESWLERLNAPAFLLVAIIHV